MDTNARDVFAGWDAPDDEHALDVSRHGHDRAGGLPRRCDVWPDPEARVVVEEQRPSMNGETLAATHVPFPMGEREDKGDRR